MPPPPPPVSSSDVAHDNDALASMLMAWYLSGYHTGYYQVLFMNTLHEVILNDPVKYASGYLL